MFHKLIQSPQKQSVFLTFQFLCPILLFQQRTVQTGICIARSQTHIPFQPHLFSKTRCQICRAINGDYPMLLFALLHHKLTIRISLRIERQKPLISLRCLRHCRSRHILTIQPIRGSIIVGRRQVPIRFCPHLLIQGNHQPDQFLSAIFLISPSLWLRTNRKHLRFASKLFKNASTLSNCPHREHSFNIKFNPYHPKITSRSFSIWSNSPSC